MKKFLILLLAAAFLVSCNLPFMVKETAAPAASESPVVESLPSATPASEVTTAVSPTTAALEGTELNLGGVDMVVPSCLPVSASGVIVPAQPQGEGPGSVWPQHRKISFSGYPLSDKFWEPEVNVYPVSEYASLYADSSTQVTILKSLLATRPTDVASLPFLPNLGAAQAFHVKLKYLDFQNGSGVRYLTEYAQYYVPFNNYDLFYTFQGLTSDEKYWISVTFPINHAILPATPDSTEVPQGGLAIPQMTSPSWESDMQAYYASMKTLMEANPDDSYNPGIDCLDRYIQSLNIGD
jgi:hypothetical protein